MPVRPLLISLGNRYRGDDGAGPMVLDSLRAFFSPPAELVENPGDIGQLIAAWQNRDEVYLVDSAVSDRYPIGQIIELDGLTADFPAETSLVSSHGLNVAEALLLARMLGDLPGSLWIYAIVGGNFAMGTGLDPAVQASVVQVAARIKDKLESRYRVPGRQASHA